MMNALLAGLVWSLMWMLYVFIIMHFFPWEMLHDYPEDIKKASTLEKPSAKKNAAGKITGALLSLVILGFLICSPLWQFSGAKASFITIFIYLLVVTMSWNVIDLLIVDFLVLCTITPKFMVFPGTEGCRGYKDYWFHFKGFLIGILYSALMALIFAGIDFALLTFLIW